MRLRAAALVALALGPLAAAALDDAGWPPPPEVLGRMRDLQARIGDPGSTKEERDAARSELSRLLKGPAASDKDDTRGPARAAIDPYPSVVKPIDDRMPPILPPPTARLEVLDPPRHRQQPFALEPGQPPRRRTGVGGGDLMRQFSGERFAEDAVGIQLGVEVDDALFARRRREEREDPAAHPSLPHPRQVEVAAAAAVAQPCVVLPGERVVVAVEDRDHRPSA